MKSQVFGKRGTINHKAGLVKFKKREKTVGYT